MQSVPAEQELRAVQRAAAELKLVYATTEHAAPARREEYLKEILKRNLKAVPDGRRDEFLRGLEAEFPVFSQAAEVPEVETEPERPPEDDPAAVLEWFMEVSRRTFGTRQWRELEASLRDSGLIADDPPGQGAEVSFTLPKDFPLDLRQPISGERLMVLLGLLAGFYDNVSRVAEQVNLTLKLGGARMDRKQMMESFIAGTESADKLTDLVDRDRLAALSLLFGTGPFFKKAAQRFEAIANPDDIETTVRQEGSSGFLGKGLPERSWQKYKEIYSKKLSAEQFPDLLQDWYRNVVREIK